VITHRPFFFSAAADRTRSEVMVRRPFPVKIYSQLYGFMVAVMDSAPCRLSWSAHVPLPRPDDRCRGDAP
jgi:hypothetical protein